MAWLNNTSAVCILKIDGDDYSQNLTSIQLSDQSATNTGIILTGGTISLAELPGENKLEDYSKTLFRRNAIVLIDLVIDGTTYRHPRGNLRVLSSLWNAEERTHEVIVGCQLSMVAATDNIDSLKSLSKYTLPDDAGFGDLSQSLQASGEFIWWTKDGRVEKRDFFGDDGLGSNKEEAAWVSVRDVTALSSSPLGGSATVPDTIKVTYSWQEVAGGDGDGDTDPNDGKPQETDTTESTYWLEHPGRYREEQTVCTLLPNGRKDCKEVMVDSQKRTFNVTKTSSSTRKYGGPGGSVTTEISITRGPAVEMQGTYYAELYSWKLARNKYKPNGIPLEGLNTVIQQRSEKTYEYGPGGEVKKTVQRNYKNMISAMTQNDWRSGLGSSRGFLTNPPDDKLFLDQLITATYEYFDDRTVETTVTVASSAKCNGVGIYPVKGARLLQNIDATNNGMTETTKRTSSGGLLNPDQPPRNPDGKKYITESAVYKEESVKYKPIPGLGSIEYETTIPFSNEEWTEATARSVASNFAKRIKAFMEGDAAGVRVAETMRQEIFGYYPGMPFSYFDSTYNALVKCRMNATGWAITQSEAVVATDGIHIGISNGTVAEFSNTPDATRKSRKGRSAVDYNPPTVTGETKVDQGRPYDVEEYIAVDVWLAHWWQTGNGDDGFGVVDDWDLPIELTFEPNVQNYVSGMIVSKDAEILHVDAIGSIPDNGETILESETGVLVPDLFDPENEDLPERIFFVTLGAPAVTQTYDVRVFAAAADQEFQVELGPEPPNVIHYVETIQDWQIDVAELPFMVQVWAEPADQIFMVRTSAEPPDKSFDIRVSAEPTDNIFDVSVLSLFDVEVGVAPADQVFLVLVDDAPALPPDQTFIVGVGSFGPPQADDPDATFDVEVSYEQADRIFDVSVGQDFVVDVAEAPFRVEVFAEPPDTEFSVEVSAKAADQTLSVTVAAAGADEVFAINVVDTFTVDVARSPVLYNVSGLDQNYLFTGNGFVSEPMPTVRTTIGQQNIFNVMAPSRRMWIKDVPDPGPGQLTVDGVQLAGNGSDSSPILMRFMEAGTYYYVNENPDGPNGEIIVKSPFAPDAEFTLEITVNAKPADQTFEVAPLDGLFKVQVPSANTFVVDVLDEIFTVLVAEPSFDVRVIQDINVNAVDQTFKVSPLDQVFDVKAGSDPFVVAALDDIFMVRNIEDLNILVVAEHFVIEVSEP